MGACHSAAIGGALPLGFDRMGSQAGRRLRDFPHRLFWRLLLPPHLPIEIDEP